MLSFRNRLLILLIGLVVGAQTVTLFTALRSTAVTERRRADNDLAHGAAIAMDQLGYRQSQLANAVDVLVRDHALLGAVTSDEATAASALGNHAARIHADLALALDLDGKVLGVGEGTTAVDPGLLAVLGRDLQDNQTGAHFVMSASGVYQVFTAVPEDVAQLVMGFRVDNARAMELQKSVGEGVELAFLNTIDGKSHVVAATLAALKSGDGVIDATLSASPRVVKIGGVDYLATAKRLSGSGPALDIAVLKPMDLVQSPYLNLAYSLARIFGLALLATIIAGIYLGRTAARPVQRLAEGASRVAAGDYSKRVDASGGQELEHLAESFNSMQNGIAQRESQLLHVARHDPATGLPNRTQLEEWLEQRLEVADQPPRVAIVQLMVTNLQEISATLGFEIAEGLVSHLAEQLSAWNEGRGMVARLDTSAFAVAMELSGETAAMEVAQQLRERSSAPFTTAGITLQAAVVLGVAVGPRDGANAAEALRCAHAALEAAILQRTNIACFAASNDEAQRRRLKLGVDLPQALDSGQLFLHFQPKMRLADGRISGVEALVRWRHPFFGLVSPAEFIPIAERTGASARLTHWVLHTALEQLARWHRDGYPLEMAVNLSAADILDERLLQQILEALREVKVPAGSLTLEITESVLMHEPAAARRNIELLRVAGVRFSIDDFGTGFSSLSQLRELAADELKIDQSFVRGSFRGAEQVAVLRAIIDLAHGLGLRTVAEGVETEEQKRLLAELGCNHAQGYLVSRPDTAEELLPLLQASSAAPDQEFERTQSLRVLELRRRDS